MANDSRIIGSEPTLSKVSLSDVTSSPEALVGTRRFEKGADWIYGYNGATNAEIRKNRGCRWQTNASGYTVTGEILEPTTCMTSNDFLFGVVVNASIPTGYYGWIMTRGQCNVVVSQSVAVGGEWFHMVLSGAFTTCTSVTGNSTHAQVRAAGVYLASGSDTTTTETVAAYIKSYWV